MLTASEKATAIRTALKKAGFSSNRVSVKTRRGGYSTEYHITIKDNSISEMQVKDICAPFESVTYDEGTGEILGGCNDYILVARDYRAPVDGSEYLGAVSRALTILEEDGQGVRIEGTRWALFRGCGEYIGSCETLEKVDYRLSRFRISAWNGADDIARCIKAHELDAAYLEHKKRPTGGRWLSRD